jgi:hypothetical protein
MRCSLIQVDGEFRRCCEDVVFWRGELAKILEASASESGSH